MRESVKKQLIPIIFFIGLCLLFILLDFGFRVELSSSLSMGADFYAVSSVPILPSFLSIIILIPLGWWLFFKRDNSDLKPYEKEKFGKIMRISLFLYLIIMIFRQIILFYYKLPLEKTPLIFLITLQIVITEGYYLKDFGIHRKHFWRNIFMAISLFLLGLIILLAEELLIFSIISPEIILPLIEYFSTVEIFWLAMLAFIFQLFCVGISEELFFRGYLFGKLDKSIGFLKSAILSSVIFAFFHLSWYLFPYYPFVDIPGLFYRLAYTGLFGFIMCFIYKHSGSLVGPILLHGIFNTVGSAFSFAGEMTTINFIFASYTMFQWTVLIILEIVIVGISFVLILKYLKKYIRLFGIKKEEI